MNPDLSFIMDVGSALAGAFIALVLRELVIFIRRPILGIDFEEHLGTKPYVPVLTVSKGLEGVTTKPIVGVDVKFFRLVVRNCGFSSAKECEAKLTVSQASRPPFTAIAHWARRDPAVFQSLADIYAPVTINRGDQEVLDILKLEEGASAIKTMAFREFEISPNQDYELRVSVFPSNSGPTTKKFKLKWDGTYDGFNWCLQSA